jgi:hypothetical protein
MKKIRFRSLNLDLKELIGEGILELATDNISLKGLLQVFEDKAGGKLDLISTITSDSRPNEWYVILLNGHNLNIQRNNLDTTVRLEDGDELCINRLNMLLGG